MIHATGPLLSIDLDSRSTGTEDVSAALESFVGGRGVCTKLAHDRIPFDADPLGAENRLLFATGPLQASQMSFTGRTNCTGVSPLTDGLLSSNAGGFVSRPFADTGNAVVELMGQTDQLLGIHVSDDDVSFEAVPNLAGATVDEVAEYLGEAHDIGPDRTLCIGPAGENLVRFASIMTTEHRAFGRGGLGAVMGAKNVKFLTFAGDSAPDVDLDDEVTAAVHEAAATADNPMKDAGTVSIAEFANAVDALPTRYFQDTSFDGVESIGSGAVIDHKYKKGTCSQCAFACKLPTRDEESGLETEGPEYETVFAFGANADNDDFRSIMTANDLCDSLGMDTISCGDVVAAYLESEGEFGNTDLVEDLIEKIARREGVGDGLAEGIDRVHEELGVENWTVKGMEFPAHDGRTLNGQGLSFATSNRGADHMFAELYHYEYPTVSPAKAVDPGGTEGKVDLLIAQENKNAVKDSGVLCKFSNAFVDRERWEAIFQADYEAILETGHRIVQLERHFNNRRGVDRGDDRLPYDLPDFEASLSTYYDRRGWNEDGTVPEEALGGAPASALGD